MDLPNPGMAFSPFDILTAEEMNDLVENIEALAAGTGLNDGAITRSKISSGVDMAFTSYTPTITGFSVNPTGGIYRYSKIGREVTLLIRQPNTGTSNSGDFTISLPVPARVISGIRYSGFGSITNSSVAGTTPGMIYINPDSAPSTATIYLNASFATFTASGAKAATAMSIIYEAAS